MAGSLRSFVDADRQAVLGLSRHALARIEEQVGKPLWGTRAELDDDLDSWSGSPSESLRVIEEDGRVVGFGGVQLDGNGAVVRAARLARVAGPQDGEHASRRRDRDRK